jgi:hypothetical protein
MKTLMLFLMVLGTGMVANAQPGPVPGTQRTDLVFNGSDVVCSCYVMSTAVEGEELLQPPPNVLRHILATVEVRDAFKPTNLQPGDRLTIRFVREYPGVSTARPTVMQSDTAILFLKKKADGTYEFADTWMGAKPFQVIPQASSGTGLARLESALLNILEQAQPGGPNHDDLRALYMLEGLPALGPEGMARMPKLANSPYPNVALAAIGTLLKTKSPQNVQLLKDYLDNYQGAEEPVSVWSIGAYLREVRAPEALPALEALSGSRFTSVQLGAMDALRNIKKPSSASILVQRLDDPNSTVRYQAVITLAETFGKGQEFAPSMKLFDDDPEKYVGLWKSWWSQQGGVPPQPNK